MTRHAWLLIVGCALACHEPATTTHRFSLTIAAVDDRGDRLPDVRFRVDDREAGVTDRTGELAIELAAAEGQRLTLAATCPAGHGAAVVPDAVTLRPLQGVAGAAQNQLALTATCPRAQRWAAVVVRAIDGADLPVLIDGVVRARTDAAGAAHLTLAVDPGTSLRVALDTSAKPRLQPQAPSRVLTVGERDELLVFDQTFVEKRRRVRARAAAKPPAPRRPIRVQ